MAEGEAEDPVAEAEEDLEPEEDPVELGPPKPLNTCVGFTPPDVEDPVAELPAEVVEVDALIRVGFWAPQGLSARHADSHALSWLQLSTHWLPNVTHSKYGIVRENS